MDGPGPCHHFFVVFVTYFLSRLLNTGITVLFVKFAKLLLDEVILDSAHGGLDSDRLQGVSTFFSCSQLGVVSSSDDGLSVSAVKVRSLLTRVLQLLFSAIKRIFAGHLVFKVSSNVVLRSLQPALSLKVLDELEIPLLVMEARLTTSQLVLPFLLHVV